jgi:hypothetical protein
MNRKFFVIHFLLFWDGRGTLNHVNHCFTLFLASPSKKLKFVGKCFFFNYLLALKGGPTFLGFFLYTHYKIRRKKTVSIAMNTN